MSNMRALYRKEVTDHLHLQTVEACRENMPRPTKTDKIICNKKQLRRQIFCILVKLFSSNNVMPSIFETLQAVWDENNWRQCRNLKWNGLRMRIHTHRRDTYNFQGETSEQHHQKDAALLKLDKLYSAIFMQGFCLTCNKKFLQWLSSVERLWTTPTYWIFLIASQLGRLPCLK